MAFAGIATVWVLGTEGTNLTVKNIDFSLMLFFILSLALDLLHYIIGAWGWGRLQLNARDSGEEEIEEPKCLKGAMATLAFLKVLFTVSGYLMIILKLIKF